VSADGFATSAVGALHGLPLYRTDSLTFGSVNALSSLPNEFNANLLLSYSVETPEPQTYLMLGSMLFLGLFIAGKKIRKTRTV